MVDNIETTTTSIEEDDLELSLSLRPRNSSFSSLSTNPCNTHNNPFTKRDAQAIRRHEAKLKRDFKRKAQEDFVQNPRKVNNLGVATVAPPWLGWNGGGFQGHNGNFFSVVKDCGSHSSGSSSGISDNYQSISGPGANSSDAGSHSSHPYSQLPSTNVPSNSSKLPRSSQLDLQYNSSNPNHSKPQLCSLDSTKIERMSSSTQSSKSPEGATTPSNTDCQKNRASPSSDKDSNTTPQSITPKEAKREPRKPPRPVGVKQQQQQNQQKLLFSQMPCVSATGNGPNGKTINGFLYKYTKAEVSIVCVCHGSLFSPAEFVKHAGGVDVEFPLKHIKVDPFGLI